jgi:hypothetical protein
MSHRSPVLWKRFDSRMRELPDCQEGGVQSLALVMTLPLLIGSILLVVQLTQVLLGVMTVQYAAFSGARSAAVWIPTRIDSQNFQENEVNTRIIRGQPIDLTPDLRAGSRKFQEIFAAVAQSCVAISPARAVEGPRAAASEVAEAVDAFLIFQQLGNDPRIARWRTAVGNRWSYSFANTQVRLAFLSQPRETPTYNPVNHPVVPHRDDEAGWDESVTVIVQHEVSLVPGPGRLLFQQATWGSVPQNLADSWSRSGRRDRVPVIGSATITLAGLKAIPPFRYLEGE